MGRWSFFVIANTKTGEFEVFATEMKDWRLRLSAMKSSFKRWASQDIESEEYPYREYFRFFTSGYIYAYVFDKGEFTQNEANEHVNDLQEQIRKRVSPCKLCCMRSTGSRCPFRET
jgi:hypothetical protein